MFHLGCPLPPHPQLPSPHRPPRVIPCSPEEIEVDGGELVLDEGPERPEKVRSLQTEQRVARRPAKPGPDPVYGGGGAQSLRQTQNQDAGRDTVGSPQHRR